MDVVSVRTLRRILIVSGSCATEQAFPAGGRIVPSPRERSRDVTPDATSGRGLQ